MAAFTPVKQQKGATLIVVLLLLLIFVLLALSIAASTTSRSLVVNANVVKAQSIQAAETGSDVFLALLKEGKVDVDATSFPKCNEPYANQYHSDGSKSTTIAGSDDEQRTISLSWYVCKPDGLKPNVSCGSTNTTGCFSVVITGVACFGNNVTNPNNEACTVTRTLQGYAFKK